MVFTTFLTFLIIAFGITANIYNPGVGDKATLWLVVNKMPEFMTLLLTVGIAGATMSTADTHLNCGAANIVVDIIDPEGRMSDNKAITFSKIATVVAGVIAVGGALFFPTIMDLGNAGYAVCGGVLIPIFLIGLALRDRTVEQFKSRLSIMATRIGIIGGGIIALAFEMLPQLNPLMGGGIIPGLVSTALLTLFANVVVGGKDQQKCLDGNL
jgi:Na+/proline symporter